MQPAKITGSDSPIGHGSPSNVPSAIDARIADVFAAVHKEYCTFKSDNPDGQQGLARIRENIRDWFHSSQRRVTDTAAACFDRYLDAELDFQTAGNRGLGRLSDYVPRFAGRHRHIVSRLDRTALAGLRNVMKRHILCGYLFAEVIFPLSRETEKPVNRDHMFEMWIPMLYSTAGEIPLQSKDEDDLKAVWFSATGRKVRDHAKSLGIAWDEVDSLIVTHYFDAGMLLRLFEHSPINAYNGAKHFDKPVQPRPKGLFARIFS